MKLYMACIGGAIEGLSIEAHDVCFLAAEELSSAAEMAKARWPGKPASAHLDTLREVSHVGGFEIRLAETPPSSPAMAEDRLFFVNIGFYRQGAFGEFHDVSLVVEKSAALASARVLQTAGRDLFLAHKDNLWAVDNVQGVSHVDGYSVVVQPSDSSIRDSLFYGPSLIAWNEQ
ncbi:MAG: DUF1543 domain-containing protein [Pseudomonadota bacterium]